MCALLNGGEENWCVFCVGTLSFPHITHQTNINLGVEFYLSYIITPASLIAAALSNRPGIYGSGMDTNTFSSILILYENCYIFLSAYGAAIHT